MPAIKNRTVLEVAKNLTGFLSLDAGLTRGSAPNQDQMLKNAQGMVEKQERQLEKQKRQISDKDGQLARSQERLSKTLQQLQESQRQVSERDRQLQRAQERLSDQEGQSQEARKRLLDRSRQVAALQASSDSSSRELHDEELYSDIMKVLDRIPIDLGGGCSVDKAYLFAWLIRRYELKQTVDIGVYRGRSLFPQALAHAQFTGGVAYGVDPYSASEAREENIESADKKNKKVINRFIEETDWQAICRSVVTMRDELGYGDHCVLLRETSAAAAAYFEENDISFGMVHVDGNHDTAKVMEDLDLYLPLVAENGFIVLDDISFKSVRPAYEKLDASTTLVYERTDHDNANDFAVFRNGPPPPNANYNRRLWIRNFW